MLKVYNYSKYININEQETQQSEMQNVSVPTIVERNVNYKGVSGVVKDIILPDGRYVSDIYGQSPTGCGLCNIIEFGTEKDRYYQCNIRDGNYGVNSNTIIGCVAINTKTGKRLMKDFPDTIVLSRIITIWNERSIVEIGCKCISNDRTKLYLNSSQDMDYDLYNICRLDEGKPLISKWCDHIDAFTNGKASVMIEDDYNIIDTDGNFLLKDWCTDIYSPDENGYRVCQFEDDELDNDINLMDDELNILLPENVKSLKYIELAWGEETKEPDGEIFYGEPESVYFYEGEKNVKSNSGVSIDEKNFILDNNLNVVVEDVYGLEKIDRESNDGTSYIVIKRKSGEDIYNILSEGGLAYPNEWFDAYEEGPYGSHSLIITFHDGTKGLFNKMSMKPIVLYDGTERFRDLKSACALNDEEDRYAVVQNDDGKMNLINTCYEYRYRTGDRAIGNAPYLHYVFKKWVDKINWLGPVLFITVNGETKLLWRDGKTYGCTLNNIIRVANDTFVIEDENLHYNFLKMDEDGLFSSKWFDGVSDCYGTSCTSDFDNDLESTWYPIVEYNGKYTYLDTERFRFLFQSGGEHDNDDWDSVRWFDDCEPYTTPHDNFVFKVVEDGVEKYLNDWGDEVDENGDEIEDE
jgi:hypothetical protein